MQERKISLVLTHLDAVYEYTGSIEASMAVRKFIGKYKPGIYQLISPITNSPLIKEGEFFNSAYGNVPVELISRLNDDKNNCCGVVLAGGIDGRCLSETFTELKNNGLIARILLEGIFPRKGIFERAYRKIIHSGDYTFL